ncbi:peptidoglycan editing factor PgeF [Halioxenophilus sp. WMMB6]|uniref:peptidoglycan editing factor PgeF n=1 Tax=Halioxenophilus sp. WMMB6 TaxID=3073815 RepID=UPI00295E9267|nr:peptidoglycan editing factor PgeF [Halioxenophilus sp. WMMB6]
MSEAGLAPSFISLEWPAPKGVCALQTTRQGGVSVGPYASFNLADHVQDDPSAVVANRQLLSDQMAGVPVQWLCQVHGERVVEAEEDGLVITADACLTRTPGLACAVLTADCLPVLFCDRQASVVAAAHAGWRGLVGGILPETVAAMAVAPGQLLAYLGPAISQHYFEVGVEVLEALMASAQSAEELSAFASATRPGERPLHFYVDLYAVARAQLRRLGVEQIYGGHWCSYGDERFYSYRRDQVTGRQASVIWLQP